MQNFTLSKQFFRDVWYLTKSYWQSEEKKKAFFFLACIVGLTLAIVYMLVLLNSWNNSFYSALQNYQTEKIFDELFHFTYLAFTYIVLAVYSYYLQQVLILNWRRWLTERFIEIWRKNKTYYNLQMFGVAEAFAVAPATLIGFADMFIPALLMGGVQSVETKFIVGVLSLIQIIYLTEVGAIAIKSEVPLTFTKLFMIFLLRTLLAIPLIVLLAKVLL